MRHSLPHRRRCCPRAFIILMLVTIAPALSSAAVLDYSGTWFNKTFNAAGAAVARLDTDAQPTVTFTLDLTGDVFGGPFGFPPVTPLTLHGTLNPDQSVAFAPVFGHATYGTVVASFSSGGAVSIFCDPMPVSPPSIYARTHITGARSVESIDLRFQMQTLTGFFFGSIGNIELNIVPEPFAAAWIGLTLMATHAALRRTPSHLRNRRDASPTS